MKTSAVQYTLRGVPKAVDRALRRKSRQEGKSLNTVAVETLAEGLRVGGETLRYDDLQSLVGSWVEDPKFDAAVQAQDTVDPDLWR
ncbi:MAG TPA: hypothetical protein VG146_02850 [Verrucomicrobiae bacterium]|nr:hypothetical protein [Verrucomicrobiae bacterium]